MDNQELKNLDQLDSHEALLRKSDSRTQSGASDNSNPGQQKLERRSTRIIQQHIAVEISSLEREAVTEGTLNLNRSVTIK